jgi:hypothetical protein
MLSSLWLCLCVLAIVTTIDAAYTTVQSKYNESNAIRIKEHVDGNICDGGGKHYTGWADIGARHLFYCETSIFSIPRKHSANKKQGIIQSDMEKKKMHHCSYGFKEDLGLLPYWGCLCFTDLVWLMSEETAPTHGTRSSMSCISISQQVWVSLTLMIPITTMRIRVGRRSQHRIFFQQSIFEEQ